MKVLLPTSTPESCGQFISNMTAPNIEQRPTLGKSGNGKATNLSTKDWQGSFPSLNTAKSII